ncbi:MAG: D-aminoacyl-tRNA deacylase [Christensenellales bacterium]
MKVILQRVNYCKLTSEEFKSEIGYGLLVTIGVSVDDTLKDIEYLAKKIVNLRIFKDEENKCNMSLKDIKGDIMLVSNFTLQARIGSGTRPDFSRAGESEHALKFYNAFVDEIRKIYDGNIAIGNFKHHMHLNCELDGPFNLILESEGRK